MASRASYVLSANALILAGAALAVNQLAAHDQGIVVRVAGFAVLVIVLTCVTASVWFGIGALTTLGPRFEESDLPRGVYGWSTVDREAATYQAFKRLLAAEESLEAARCELYVTVKQQAHRYGRLRMAMRTLLAALAGFIVLVSIGAIASLL